MKTLTLKDIYLQKCETIENKELKTILFNSLKLVPEYFYEIPSSSSGKYHPSDEISEGGLLRHALKTVSVADMLAPMYNLVSFEIELCKVALFLHDCCKSGRYENSGYTEFLHPNYAAELVIEANPKNKNAKKIARLIKSHMGRWNTSKYSDKKLKKPKTKLEKFVHECDFIASRKEIIIDIA